LRRSGVGADVHRALVIGTVRERRVPAGSRHVHRNRAHREHGRCGCSARVVAVTGVDRSDRVSSSIQSGRDIPVAATVPLQRERCQNRASGIDLDGAGRHSFGADNADRDVGRAWVDQLRTRKQLRNVWRGLVHRQRHARRRSCVVGRVCRCKGHRQCLASCRQHRANGRRIRESARHIGRGVKLRRTQRCAVADRRRRRPCDDRHRLVHRQRHAYQQHLMLRLQPLI